MEQEMILTGRHIAGIVMGVLFVAVASGFAVWWRMTTRLNRQADENARLREVLAAEQAKVPEIEKDRKVRRELLTVAREGRIGFEWVSGILANKDPFTYIFRSDLEHGEIGPLVENPKVLLTDHGHVYTDSNGHAPGYLWGALLLQSCGFVLREEWAPQVPASELNAMLPPEIRGIASTMLASDRTRMGVPLQGAMQLPPLSRAANNSGDNGV